MPSTVENRLTITLSNIYFHREQAAEYVLHPTESDSRRGLKRSWKGTPVEDGEEGTSNPKSKPSSKDKGMYIF